MTGLVPLETLLRKQKLLVCVGPGGVGKTTMAAAMGLRAAAMGRRVLVLTIDPAKRLADALGLDGLDDRIQEVTTEALRARGIKVPGALHAAMFDNAVSMDSLMGRVAPNPETRDRILANRVYRAMAGSLARSHAYLAMERLYEVMQAEQYDLVILDTPPARNALDILDAPGRLASFLEEGVVKWFVRGREAKGLRGRLLQTGGVAATKLFGVVAGKEFLAEVMAFFEVFYEMRHGFRERATAIQKIMVETGSSFVLVSSTDTTHIEDARALGASVCDRGIDLASVVFNRSYERLTGDPLEIVTHMDERDVPTTVDSLWPSSVEAPPPQLGALLATLADHRERAVAANAQALITSRSLLAALSLQGEPTYVGRVQGEVSDLFGLYDLIRYFGGESPSLERRISTH